MLAVFSALVVCAPASASMTVTATGDGGGTCTLRAAIEAVNAANGGTACGPLDSGTTKINLPGNTYTPDKGQLVVTGNMEIVGASTSNPSQTVIDNTGPGRVFEVASGGYLKLTGLKVTGGQSANGANAVAYPQYGGAGADGGGILNKGGLALDHVLLTQNFTGHGGVGSDGGYDIQHDARGGGVGGSGGGIYNGAGASLTVTASTISANGTGGGGNGGTGSVGIGGLGHYPYGGDGGDGGPPGSGGGIYNLGSATITGSTISGNFTGRGGNGGNGGQGAGPSTDEEGHKFGPGRGGYGGDGGSASYVQYEYCGCYQPYNILGGGGIANIGGASLTMSDSTVSGNNTGAGGNGGGAGVGGPDDKQHSVTGSHGGFAGSGGVGGGLWTSHATAVLTNVTFSGNYTGDGGIGGNGPTSGSLGPGPGGYGGDGGGIWADGAHSPYYLQLTHVTISKNTVGAAGPPGAPGAPPEGNSVFPGVPGVRGIGSGIATGGRYDPQGTSVYLKATIIANNGLVSDSNCVSTGATPSNFFDQGGNVTWGGATCPGTSADPKLGPLQDNGGPTLTMLPASGGAGIGAVAPASCAAADQRGKPRPGNGKVNCDSGAVEVQSGEGTPGGGEENGEQPGGNPGGGTPPVSNPPAAVPPGQEAPARPLKCRKGFKKKSVKGKPKCVKVKKKHRRRQH